MVRSHSLTIDLHERPEEVVPAARLYLRVNDRNTTTTVREEQTVSQDDVVLFARFQRGDDAAFAELYRRHNQRLFNYCYRILDDAHAAEDVIHSIWERMIGLRTAPQEVGSPVGFLLRSARNLALDHQKRQKFQSSIDSAQELASTATTELSHKEELVISCLAELPEESRDLLVLHYYSGYSFSEIAEMLGKSSGAVWTSVSRARTKLKQILMKRLNGEERMTGGRSI